ncbi:MAG: TIGR03032 family protein [Pirellulales bacterium]
MSSYSPTSADTRIECAVLGSFDSWLAQSGGSLAITTYQAGKVAMVGWDGRRPTLLMRHFEKPLGLAVDGDRLALATRHEVLFFANASLLAHDYLEDQPGRYDALFLPRASYLTGDLHVHDLAFDREGLILVNTRFSCLSRLSQNFSFVPFWRPKFVTDLVPEDRCHLNGLAMCDGKPKYVTALGTTDEAGTWRANKASGGVLIDVQSGEVILGGLSMPHSPRWYDNCLWLLNSGTGELWQVDPASGRATVVCGLQGYVRGLSFAGPYALVGMCLIREKHIFGGLPIQQRLKQLHCGVAVVDLRSGAQVGMLEFTSGCEELYDVQFLPGIFRPMILNLDKPASRQAFTNPDSSFWLRPSSEITNGAAAGQTPSADPVSPSVSAQPPSKLESAGSTFSKTETNS